MPSLAAFLPVIGQGLLTTIWVAVLSIAGCAIVSVILGIARRSPRRSIRYAAGGAIELLRGASALIYLFWAFYVLPLVPGLPRLSPLVVSVLVLSLVGGAYGAEIVVSGLQAVPRGQVEASRALGLSRFATTTKVVLPQAMTQIVPAFGSLAIDLVKWTSVVSFIGVQDLLSVANMIRAITFSTVSVYVGVAALYLALCLAASRFFLLVERCLPLNRALRAIEGGSGRGEPAVRVALKSQGQSL